MKHIFFFFFLCSSVLTVCAEDWTLTSGNIWARQNGAAKMTSEKQNGADVIRLVHTGKDDWALSEGKRFAVVPGDVYELQAKMRFDGKNHAGISVVSRDAQGETIEWIYASKELTGKTEWTTLISRFIVPPGVATIEPRITGYAPATVEIDGFSMKKTETYPLLPPDTKPLMLENHFLKVETNPAGTFSITDKRTKRTWKPAERMKNFIVINEIAGSSASLHFPLVNCENMQKFNVHLTLEKEAPELTVHISGSGTMSGGTAYPPPFESENGDRLIIPMNEGISYPVEKKDIRVGRLIAYGGHGICMAFWGQTKDADGTGMAAIIETADDASIDIRSGKNGLLQVNAVWEPSFKEFRYERKLRFVFFDNGGYVAVAKRYRQYAKSIGLLVPFTEKVKKNPNIDMLLGAAN
ncbi:MAG: hypothetical protein LBN39_00525, partial [Planctomycetaceae bacterium]|nr:hypothetical protein [Planctomycetaceae bacterium]